MGVALAVVAAPPAYASSLSVTAPDTAQEGGQFQVHVSGTADEPELAWTAFVQNEPCPATFAEAQRQPDSTMAFPQGFQQGAPFSFDFTLSSIAGRPPGRVLTGTANVCSYLYHQFTSDQATVATAVNAIRLIGATKSPFTFAGRMTSGGDIRMAATCPSGCALKAVYTSSASRGSRTVTRKLRASDKPASVPLRLDAKTVSLVRKTRKKGRGGPVTVQVKVTATPPSGAPVRATRVVKVT
ncbi:MAG: hypothetical protein QOJ07_1861 [Thermoleophilaceae bacterium]|nr:hypothetical protein [Thermoleophilaceae bacterium]